MVRITGATVKLKSGEAVKADCHGNNAAILCPACKENPVLLIARPNQKGSSIQKATKCNCDISIWMDPPANMLNEPVQTVTISYKEGKT